MQRSRFSANQIINILKEGEGGTAVAEVGRTYGISKSTFYLWKTKYGGMETSELRRLRDLAEENRQLKQMYADLSLDHPILLIHGGFSKA